MCSVVFFLPGEIINDKDKCKECKGKKVISETKILEVHVDKGMKDGQKIPFRGEGDQLVGRVFSCFIIMQMITHMSSPFVRHMCVEWG